MVQLGQALNNESLRRLKSFLDEEADTKPIIENYVKGLAKDLRNTFGRDTVKVQGTDINIAYKVLTDAENNKVQFFDLKPYFQRSAKAKISKNGGWYLKIPIRHTAAQFRSAYGSKAWNQISHVQFGTTANPDVNMQRLQKVLSNSGGLASNPLGYQWKSSSITRIPSANGGNRGSYIQFRTVSNRSNPSSWINSRSDINRRIIEETNTDEEAQEVAQVINAAIERIVNQYNSKGGEY